MASIIPNNNNQTTSNPATKAPKAPRVPMTPQKKLTILGIILGLIMFFMIFFVIVKNVKMEGKVSVVQADSTKANKATAAATKSAALLAQSASSRANAAIVKAAEAKETADKALAAICRNHPGDELCPSTKDATPVDPIVPQTTTEATPAEVVNQPDITAVPEKKRNYYSPSNTSSYGGRKIDFSQVVPDQPVVDSALTKRVEALESKVESHSVLLSPFAEMAKKHGGKYGARIRAQLEALDRLPDKVQGESR